MDILSKARQIAEQGLKVVGDVAKQAGDSEFARTAAERAQTTVARLQHMVTGDNEAEAILRAIVEARQATEAATQPGPDLDMARDALTEALNRAQAYVEQNPAKGCCGPMGGPVCWGGCLITRKPSPSGVSDEMGALAAPILPDAFGRGDSGSTSCVRWSTRWAGSCDWGPWRLLPNDLPACHAVYDQAWYWRAAGRFERLTHGLRALLRAIAERGPAPSAAVLTVAP